MTKNCLQCNKEFTKPINESLKIWNNRHKYCSKECYTKSMAGKDILKEHRNITPWNKGIKGLCGKDNPKYSSIDKNCKFCDKQFTVKNYRKKSALYCSAKCKTDDNLGLSSESEKLRRNNDYKIWRELVYEKNNYTCQKCLVKGGEINAHHIQNFSDNEELRLNIDNGITFCRECHYKFHSEHGFNNNNQAQIDSFLSSVAQEA